MSNDQTTAETPTGSIARAADVLGALGTRSPGASLTDVLADPTLNKVTAHRVLPTLRAEAEHPALRLRDRDGRDNA